MCDILYDCNVATTRLAVRPVVDIVRHEVYPVEFRCYVFDAMDFAVSNYYPQRDLPDGFRSDALRSGELAMKLYPFTGTPYTADFCLTPDGLRFLEGGPPLGLGSHPCCFAPENVKPVGIALAKEKGCVAA